jgi:hypothetical protein
MENQFVRNAFWIVTFTALLKVVPSVCAQTDLVISDTVKGKITAYGSISEIKWKDAPAIDLGNLLGMQTLDGKGVRYLQSPKSTKTPEVKAEGKEITAKGKLGPDNGADEPVDFTITYKTDKPDTLQIHSVVTYLKDGNWGQLFCFNYRVPFKGTSFKVITAKDEEKEVALGEMIPKTAGCKAVIFPLDAGPLRFDAEPGSSIAVMDARSWKASGYFDLRIRQEIPWKQSYAQKANDKTELGFSVSFGGAAPAASSSDAPAAPATEPKKEESTTPSTPTM